jgi:undecaprenyl-diphosphatase
MKNNILKIVGALLVVVLFSAGGFQWYNTATGNFHAITRGEAYRSAQLDSKQLTHYLAKYHIKSVLNLRGAEPGVEWYDTEIKVSTEHHVAHFDLTLSALSEPTPADVHFMLTIFKTAPRPLLIHCLGGADRSGFGAAVWKMTIDNEPASRAARQLTILYGHLPFGKTQVMDKTFEKFAAESRS